MSKKHIVIFSLLALSLLVFFEMAVATDAPHNSAETIGCDTCHLMHPDLTDSQGPSLTSGSNENLCVNRCHFTNGLASNRPFASSDKAIPGTSGTSHAWDVPMPPISAPDNQYGLRATADLKTNALKASISKYGNSVVCSTCHQQHNQTFTPYDPYSYNSSNGDAGAASCDSPGTCSTTVLQDNTKNWGNVCTKSQYDNQDACTTNGGLWVGKWKNYALIMTSGSNLGLSRTISASTATTLTLSSAFTAAVTANDTYYITRIGSTSDWGTATGGSGTTVVDTTKTAATWTTANYWAGYYVKMTGGQCSGQRRRITGYDKDTKTLTTDPFDSCVIANPPDPDNPDTYYITSGRHFMRGNNAMNDMCLDCHYYRAPASAPKTCSNDHSITCTINDNCGSGNQCVSTSQTDVRTWDGNRKSHPVGKNLAQYNASTNPNGVNDATQFNAGPLEPASAGWGAETGPRKEANSVGYCSNPKCADSATCTADQSSGGCGATWTATPDTNLNNNVTVGFDGKISCLSCHSVHYADSVKTNP